MRSPKDGTVRRAFEQERQEQDFQSHKSIDMKTLVRSAKYFAHLCVLCAAVIAAMHFAGVLAVTPAELPALLFASWRGWVLAAAVVVLSAAYPFTGFATRRVEGFLEEDRLRVINAFRAEGFVPTADDGETMIFRAAGALRRLRLHFDDEMRVGQYGQWIELSGQRRTVARVAPRLEAFIAARARTEE